MNHSADLAIDTFLPYMRDVVRCEQSLRELNLMWRMIEASAKMNCPVEAKAILPTMAATRAGFNRLEQELVTSLVREKVGNVLDEIGTKAQYVIDIVVRNLYERTADVGFLATDRELCAFVAGLHDDADAIRLRLRAYRSKYTVYDEILASSDASPLQAYRLLHGPVLEGEILEVREKQRPKDADVADLGADAVRMVDPESQQSQECWVRWKRVDSFFESGPQSRHYTLDYLTGQIIELHGPEAMLLHHTYGTNGIVLELEVALTPAVEWTECIATFEQFDAALEFADRFGSAPGLEKKEVCFVAAPIPQYFTSLAEHLPANQHAVLLLVAPHSEAGMRDMVAQHGGQVTYRKTADEVASSHKTLLEYTWNHTTLHALKVDKGLTYIQSGFNPMHRLKQVKALEAALKGEVMMHLEFLRTKEGAFNCSGLQIIRYTTDERLNQIMQIYRDHGVQINNPHVYIVEDGKQNNLDPAVVGMKRRFDPQGLLNPGKLRSWYTAEPTAPVQTPVRQTA